MMVSFLYLRHLRYAQRDTLQDRRCPAQRLGLTKGRNQVLRVFHRLSLDSDRDEYKRRLVGDCYSFSLVGGRPCEKGTIVTRRPERNNYLSFPSSRRVPDNLTCHFPLLAVKLQDDKQLFGKASKAGLTLSPFSRLCVFCQCLP